jgi:hypothetical protein
MSKSSRPKVAAPQLPEEKPRPAPRPWQKFAFAISAVLLFAWVIFLALMAKK